MALTQSVVETAPTQQSPSMARMFTDRVRESPHREAFRFPDGEEWISRTWLQTGDEVTRLAAGLLALGVLPEERVSIISGTRYDWVLADLAVLCSGAATTTVYPTSIPDEVVFILQDSGSRVVFAEDDAQLATLRERRAELPGVARVVTFDGTPDSGQEPWVITAAELGERGDRLLTENPSAVADRVDAARPEHLATLVYTSGTTGRPKGVRLPHRCWTYIGAAVIGLEDGMLGPDDLQYLWLPLAHAFGKVLLAAQVQVGLATAIDGRVDRIVDNLAVVRPTFMGAAPRIFEKAYGRIATLARAEGGAKAKIFDWACRVGVEASRLRRAGRPVPPLLTVQVKLADRLVFAKVRERFGGRIRYFISGSAALSLDVAEWFHAAGMLILEGYGLTETSAGSTVNRPVRYRLGTVGPALPGTEIRIADDGEVLIKGPGVMDGYHGLEDETTRALLPGGWMATGDIGELDDEGFLRITDRKKDLFKTSGGKYVAPSSIEGMFTATCPLASKMIVHGAERQYCVALIALDPDAVADWAQRNGMAGASYEEVATSAAMRAEIDGYVQRLNDRLNRWETIKKFTILPRDLTVEDGEITPSLKLRRRVVEDRYRPELDALYA